MGGAVDQPRSVQLQNVSGKITDENRIVEGLPPKINGNANWNNDGEDDVKSFVISVKNGVW